MTVVSYESGEMAYEAYKLASDGVSLVSGAPLPEWGEQELPIRSAWSAVEDGVIVACGLQVRDYRADLEEATRLLGYSTGPDRKVAVELRDKYGFEALA